MISFKDFYLSEKRKVNNPFNPEINSFYTSPSTMPSYFPLVSYVMKDLEREFKTVKGYRFITIDEFKKAIKNSTFLKNTHLSVFTRGDVMLANNYHKL